MGDSLKQTLAPVVVQTVKTLAETAVKQLTDRIQEHTGDVDEGQARQLLVQELGGTLSDEAPTGAPGGSWLDENAKVVTILIGGQQYAVELSEKALERARLAFNPSGLEDVIRVKALVAALYSILEPLVAERHPVAGREAATAMTEIQGGAMFAVSAMTAKL